MSGEPPGSDTQHDCAMLCLSGTPPAKTGKTGKNREKAGNRVERAWGASRGYPRLSHILIFPEASPIRDRKQEKRLKPGMFPGDAPGDLEGAK